MWVMFAVDMDELDQVDVVVVDLRPSLLKRLLARLQLFRTVRSCDPGIKQLLLSEVKARLWCWELGEAHAGIVKTERPLTDERGQPLPAPVGLATVKLPADPPPSLRFAGLSVQVETDEDGGQHFCWLLHFDDRIYPIVTCYMPESVAERLLKHALSERED